MSPACGTVQAMILQLSFSDCALTVHSAVLGTTAAVSYLLCDGCQLPQSQLALQIFWAILLHKPVQFYPAVEIAAAGSGAAAAAAAKVASVAATGTVAVAA